MTVLVFERCDRSDQCMDRSTRVARHRRRCNKPGYVVFHGADGPFYRCHACYTRLVNRTGLPVILDGVPVPVPERVSSDLPWEPFI